MVGGCTIRLGRSQCSMAFEPDQLQPDGLGQSGLAPITGQKVAAAKKVGGWHMVTRPESA